MGSMSTGNGGNMFQEFQELDVPSTVDRAQKLVGDDGILPHKFHENDTAFFGEVAVCKNSGQAGDPRLEQTLKNKE